jgi:hypothetical protein
MEGREIFQQRIRCFHRSTVDGFDIVMTFVADIDAAGLFSLTIEILERPLLAVAAERTRQSINSPFCLLKRTCLQVAQKSSDMR